MLVEAVLAAARATVGTKETLPNSGPEIDVWLANVGQKPGQPWCVAWTYSMYAIGAKACGLANPHPKTAGSLRCWGLAGDESKRQKPEKGAVVVFSHIDGEGGHVGIVEDVLGDYVTTIEANTNAEGSRNGNCVARHTWRWKDGHRRKLALIGFLVFEQNLGQEVSP